MKITMNGRDLKERMDTLGQQELRYFEEVKSTGLMVIGAIVFICIAGVLHYFTGVPLDFGADHIINAFKTVR
jgi:hypothetical protein